MIRRFAFLGDVFLVAFIGSALVLRSASITPDSVLIFLNILAFIPLVFSAGRYAIHRKISVELLASIALFASMVSGEWFSAAFINLMLASARAFQRFVEDRGRRAISSLAKLRPSEAVVKRSDGNKRISIKDIKVSDELVIVAGESIAADGTIVEGEGDVNESSITGESIPVEKEVGGVVIGGTILLSGGIIVKVDRIGEESVLGRIMRLVTEAETRESRLQSVASKFASIYIIISLVAALAIFFFSRDLRLVLSVLLVVCADDIAVAIPLAFLAAIAVAAKKGAIIKGAPFVENLAKAKTFFFDKTGTITTGKMEISEKVFFSDIPKDLFCAVRSTLSLSTHPSALAVAKSLSSNDKEVAVSEFKEERGLGMSSLFKGEQIIAGRPKFLEKMGVIMNEEEKKTIQSILERGSSTVSVAFGKKIIATFGLKDGVRKEASEAVEGLRKQGIQKIIMLTGDNSVVAERVASSIGIKEFRSELLPEDKIDIINSKEFLPPVIMVGDGVNDAAALAGADVGIAMGGIGSEAAVESADIVLMKDNLSAIPEMLFLSREVFNVVKQNIVIWAAVNIIGLALVFTGTIGPTGAAVFNFVTDFIPILNSVRVFRMHRLLKR